jgi:hypothetical protein
LNGLFIAKSSLHKPVLLLGKLYIILEKF